MNLGSQKFPYPESRIKKSGNVMLLTCLMPELEEVLAHEVRLLRAARLHVHAVQGEPGLTCRNNSLQLT